MFTFLVTHSADIFIHMGIGTAEAATVYGVRCTCRTRFCMHHPLAQKMIGNRFAMAALYITSLAITSAITVALVG